MKKCIVLVVLILLSLNKALCAALLPINSLISVKDGEMEIFYLPKQLLFLAPVNEKTIRTLKKKHVIVSVNKYKNDLCELGKIKLKRNTTSLDDIRLLVYFVDKQGKRYGIIEVGSYILINHKYYTYNDSVFKILERIVIDASGPSESTSCTPSSDPQ